MTEEVGVISVDINGMGPYELSRLLDLTRASPWNERSVNQILQRQLEAPLFADLMTTGCGTRELIIKFQWQRPSGHTFGAELASPAPAVELLDAIKQFAQQVCDQSEHPLHGAPARILYYAAISAALKRCRERITSLSDNELRIGIEWAAAQIQNEELSALLVGVAASITND